MAQYTTALASEYNDMQYKVQDILGARQGVPSSYGYNNASLINSSPVSQGQEIKQGEWDNLKHDLDTLRYYHYASLGTYETIATGNQIMWSNIVSYQNVCTAMDNLSQSFHTYTTSSKFGYNYPHLKESFASYGYPSGWGGYGASVTTIELSGSFTFSSRANLQAIFNGGGYFAFNPYFSGGTIGTSGTKDYVFRQLASLCGINWGRSQWWTYGGSNGTAQTQTLTATASGSGYSPYGSSVGDLYVRTQATYNGNNVISFNFKAIDYATDASTSSGGGYTEPPVTADVSAMPYFATPGGYSVPSGSGLGVIDLPSPSLSASWV